MGAFLYPYYSTVGSLLQVIFNEDIECRVAGRKGLEMTKQYKIIDNITTLYIFIMTFAVSFIISLVQSNDTNLSGKKFIDFSLRFLGKCDMYYNTICVFVL